jgi:hypothetical protein
MQVYRQIRSETALLPYTTVHATSFTHLRVNLTDAQKNAVTTLPLRFELQSMKRRENALDATRRARPSTASTALFAQATQRECVRICRKLQVEWQDEDGDSAPLQKEDGCI